VGKTNAFLSSLASLFSFASGLGTFLRFTGKASAFLLSLASFFSFASRLGLFLRFTGKERAFLVGLANLFRFSSRLGAFLCFTGKPKPFLFGASTRLLLFGLQSGPRLCFLGFPGQAGLFLLRERFSQPGLRLPDFLGEFLFGFASRA